jgi:hypothetical protein
MHFDEMTNIINILKVVWIYIYSSIWKNATSLANLGLALHCKSKVFPFELYMMVPIIQIFLLMKTNQIK